LLSRKSDVEVQQLLWRINAEEENSQRLNVSDLLKDLDQIRHDGYAYTEGTVNPLTGVIAVEMPTPPSQPPMALGIGCGIEELRTNRERFLELLRDALRPYQSKAVPKNHADRTA
jgi:DNA-binding IclR family transcriptional regulator